MNGFVFVLFGATSNSYFYMVAAWGGYIFIINLIPFHAFALLISGRYSHRLYVAYCTFYIIGTIMSMNIMFVGFIAVTSPEHLASKCGWLVIDWQCLLSSSLDWLDWASGMGVFALLQLYNVFFYVRSLVPPAHMKIIIFTFATVFGLGFAGIIVLSVLGVIPLFTGRLLALVSHISNQPFSPMLELMAQHLVFDNRCL